MSSDLTGLVRAIARTYRADAAIDLPAAPALVWAAGRLDEAATLPARRRPLVLKPVRRHVAAAVKAAEGGRLAALADGFARVESDMAWRQNPNYTVDRMGPGYLDNYGYFELVGPYGAVPADDLIVGFLLLGPGLHYPDHNHPAEEVYHVVGGVAEWRREGIGWHDEPPGAVVHHPPMVRHATRTLTEPLLALYCWRGEIGVAADLTA